MATCSVRAPQEHTTWPAKYWLHWHADDPALVAACSRPRRRLIRYVHCYSHSICFAHSQSRLAAMKSGSRRVHPAPRDCSQILPARWWALRTVTGCQRSPVRLHAPHRILLLPGSPQWCLLLRGSIWGRRGSCNLDQQAPHTTVLMSLGQCGVSPAARVNKIFTMARRRH